MSDDNGNGIDDIGPLTVSEIKKLRRMIEDDVYHRRIRKTVKIWMFTLGTVASLTVGLLSAWKELATRFWK